MDNHSKKLRDTARRIWLENANDFDRFDVFCAVEDYTKILERRGRLSHWGKIAKLIGKARNGNLSPEDNWEVSGMLMGLVDEMQRLRSKEKSLKKNVDEQRRALEEKNRQLDALGRVWCDGGCHGGMHRYIEEPVTAQQVAFLIHNAGRAKAWYINHEGRKKYKKGTDLQEIWDKARHQIHEEIQKKERKNILERAKAIYKTMGSTLHNPADMIKFLIEELENE